MYEEADIFAEHVKYGSVDQPPHLPIYPHVSTGHLRFYFPRHLAFIFDNSKICVLWHAQGGFAIEMSRRT